MPLVIMVIHEQQGGYGFRRLSVFAINNCYRAMLSKHCSRYDHIPTQQGEERCAAREVFIELIRRQSQDRGKVWDGKNSP
jgi:hypothetical protein